MSQVLWKASSDYIQKSELFRFQQYVEKKYNKEFSSYEELYRWSVDYLENFWESIFLFFNISYSGSYDKVLDWDITSKDFIDSKWFEGISLNYAQHIFRNADSDIPAIKFANETDPCSTISWTDLQGKVSAIQQFLINEGVVKGDRIVAVLNNTVDTIAIFLAVNSLGAIWSCCSPDFGDVSIAERFIQIAPKVLFVETEYQYNNKVFSKHGTFTMLKNELTTLTCTVGLYSKEWHSIFSTFKAKDLTFVQVPFNHPIWILYSSGTTGKPKAITHSTGGNLIEHYKALALHQNVKKGDNFLWYSTTGWMMWNYALSSLLCGATLCIFNGAITHKRHYTFWKFLINAKVDHLGAGAVYYSSLKELVVHNYAPRVIGSTGSPLPDAAFENMQYKFPDTHIISLSGGTDVCSAFLSGCCYLPVYAGQLQCRTLGSAIEAYNDEGQPVYDEVGELVILKPMPSMPLYFWSDKDNVKYRESYYEKFPNVWAHGDWIKISKNEGIVIYGRSDATLNRGGVRIGTAEIYNAVNSLSTIKDSMVVCIDHDNGSSDMLLFVVMEDNYIFDDSIKTAIKHILRTQYSPRHVPDKIFQVEDIPYTLSGKKLELPIKKIFSGVAIDKAVSKDIMRNPDALKCFQEIYNGIV